jgi:hypothetical protein
MLYMDLLGLIKPVLSHHAVVPGLDQLYSYDHNRIGPRSAV